MHRILALFVILLAFSCAKDQPAHHAGSKRAFYYWQTAMYNFDWNDSLFRSMEVDRMYFRFFDVDWNAEVKAPVPVSPLELYSFPQWKDSTELIPVVFITNETFKNLDLKGSEALAAHVHKKVMGKLNTYLLSEFNWNDGWWEQNPYNVKSKALNEQFKHDSVYAAKIKLVKEVQFDCDWTKSTEEKYFAFLAASKRLFKEQVVSSTVRLYQYRYPKEAGLPPVSRGMLMCYNAGDIKSRETLNSVFDKKEVMEYLDDADEYPIPLDYALPIFEWAVLYQDGKFAKILPAEQLLNNYGSLLTSKTSSIKIASEDFVFGNTASSVYIRKGDELRFETPDMNDVSEVATWLSDHKNNTQSTITFYHLNQHDLEKNAEAIKRIFGSF